MRVAFLVLDGMPARHVGRRHTPVLAALAAEGGWAPAGGVAVMPSCTYPNHATFVTGALPARHGIRTNADAGIPHGPTVFETSRPTAAVLGDQHLVAVMAAERADRHWPPAGELPAGTALDDLGYAADSAVVERLVAVLDDPPDLLVGHFNEPDTAGHLHGPDSEVALAQCRSTDAHLGVVLHALAREWDDWVVIVVSDHDQEPVTVSDPVDLAAAAERAGVGVAVIPEGGAALLTGPDPSEGRWLDAVPGVAGHQRFGPDERLAWTTTGRYVASTPIPLRGVHGSPRQRAQVAVVGGGHPAVASLAAAVRRERPRAESWAGVLARLLLS